MLQSACLPYAFQVDSWHALSNQGVDDSVYSLAKNGSDLYVGGDFRNTGDGSLTNLGSIARYDTSDASWHALSDQGLNGQVNALVMAGSDLYVGGGFSQTGDGTLTNLGFIARYDTSDASWHTLSNQGLNDIVYTLMMDGNDLYVGGVFSQTGDGTLTNLGGIARYDTSDASWHALSNQGLNDRVNTLVMAGSDLYVGGSFSQTGDGTLTNLGFIARYNTSDASWHTLSNQGLNDIVYTLMMDGNDLYVGGEFSQTGDGTLTDLGFMARYDTSDASWHALPNQGLAGSNVSALALDGNDLYVGGMFFNTGDGTINDLGYIARYDTSDASWHALPNQGLNNGVNALAVSDGSLYVGGAFSQTADGSLTNLGSIARGELAWPEIQVRDGATSIPNGSGRVNFGATIAGTPIDKTFTVVSSGSVDLILTEPISVPTGFSLLHSFGSITVTAGNSTTFSVRLDAASSGAYTGTLQFENNVPDENPFNFTVNGSVTSVVFYMPVLMKAE